MVPAIFGIDHTIIGVRDLEAARRAWQRLGFTATPRGRHIGWGTANYCLMFPLDYVELLGIVDPAQYVHGLDRFLTVREGLLGLAFATEDAAAAHAAFAAAGLDGGPPQDLARLLDLPEGTVQPAFRLVHPGDRAALGLDGFVCQHLTPALLRRPGWLHHANTARRIRAVTVGVADPAAVAAPYRALLGADAVTEGDGGVTVRLGAALCHFGPAESEFGGMLGMAIEVADLETAGRVLYEAGVRFRHTGDGLDIDPRDATGVALSLVAG